MKCILFLIAVVFCIAATQAHAQQPTEAQSLKAELITVKARLLDAQDRVQTQMQLLQTVQNIVGKKGNKETKAELAKFGFTFTQSDSAKTKAKKEDK